MNPKAHSYFIKTISLGALISTSLLFSCATKTAPKIGYNEVSLPAAPDYSDLKYWASHPDIEDPADKVPGQGLKDEQDQSAIDVFFIHPTTFDEKDFWNGNLSDEKLNEKTDATTILYQASIFNGTGRVYAPRYRQMTYGGFFADSTSQRSAYQAFSVAYKDVKNAFSHYLAYENEGRPFVIASHSQGTAHAIHLIREELDGQELSEQLVAAYLVGWPVFPDTFKVLKPCDSPEATGCYTSWCTFAEEFIPDNYEKAYAGAVCTNPVSWRLDSEVSPQEMHKGTLLKNFDKLHSKALKAQVHDAILWVSKPDVPFKFLYNFKNYHIADFNLFWVDVRENVALRTSEYLRKRP